MMRKKSIGNIVAICIWGIVLIVCIINRDIFTVDNIVEMSPSNKVLAVLVIWALFALKSVSVVFYSGVLFAASGVLFPLIISIPVSIIGTCIMITIPFFLGKRYGADGAEALMEKNPKIRKMHEIRTQNDFLFAFIVRLLARLPNDPISMYMGATDSNFLGYFMGSLLGLMPEVLAITILGTSLTDTESAFFRISVIVLIVLTVVSMLIFVLYVRNKTKDE